MRIESCFFREKPQAGNSRITESFFFFTESHGRSGDCVPGRGDHDPLQERPEVRDPGVWGHRFVCARAGREDFLLHIRAAVVPGCHLQEECGLQRHYQERRCSCSLLLTDCRPCLQLAWWFVYRFLLAFLLACLPELCSFSTSEMAAGIVEFAVFLQCLGLLASSISASKGVSEGWRRDRGVAVFQAQQEFRNNSSKENCMWQQTELTLLWVLELVGRSSVGWAQHP